VCARKQQEQTHTGTSNQIHCDTLFSWGTSILRRLAQLMHIGRLRRRASLASIVSDADNAGEHVVIGGPP